MAAGGKLSSEDAREGRNRPFLDLVRGAVSALDWSGRLVVAACLMFMFAALLANVVLRYAFGSGITWAYEIHAVLLPWLVAGGLVIASARGRNISITLLPALLRGRTLLGLNVIIQVIVLVISVSVLWSSQHILTASQFQTFSSLGVKQVWGYSSLVYAFGAMAMIAVLDILRSLAGEDVTDFDPEHASLS